MDPAAHCLDEIRSRMVACRDCKRLVSFREEIGRTKRRAYRDWEYWSRPVPGFGDPQAQLLVIGLAPGPHGSNRTGRVFTGDDSGVFLYRALHRAGFANQPSGLLPDDGLQLRGVYITAVCRCVPPDNKPTAAELLTCQHYLTEEMACLDPIRGVVLLGKIAMDGLSAAYRRQGISLAPMTFGHNCLYQPAAGLPWWLTSYHPSRQNTQTGRLTEAMFDAVWSRARELLNAGSAAG